MATAQTLDSEQSAFLTLINNYRAQNGVGPLQVSATLQSSSQWMSADMATKNYFSHTDSLGRDPFTRMTAYGYTYYPEGENIAAGYSDAQSTLNQWINACDPDSTGACTYAHRKNMLNGSFKAIGIGRAYGASSSYRWYWTTDFGGYVDVPLQTGGGTPSNAVPTADSASPNTGTGSTQAFRFIYSDANGYLDLASLDAMFSANGSAANACRVRYSQATNTLSLMNDAGTGWLAGITPGTSATSTNTQCTLSGSGSSAYGSGNSVTANLALTFKAAFAGTRTIYMSAQDKSAASSGWQSRGTWTVPGVANVAPTVVSATPSSGTVSTTTFKFVGSDGNGYTDLQRLRVIVNSSVSSAWGCYVSYDRLHNAVFLMNDAGTAWSTPLTLGTTGSLQNSYCLISGAGSSSTGSGATLTLNLNMSLYHALTGTKNIYMQAQDNAGLSSGWQLRGSIYVP